MARKAVRLSDIAEKLGVSTVTVSNALANQRGVSEELREKIKEMASEMGYHAPGTQIMAKTAVNIGVLVQERYLGNGSSFYWRLYQELAIACAAHNCLLAFCVLKPDEEKNTVLPVILPGRDAGTRRSEQPSAAAGSLPSAGRAAPFLSVLRLVTVSCVMASCWVRTRRHAAWSEACGGPRARAC